MIFQKWMDGFRIGQHASVSSTRTPTIGPPTGARTSANRQALAYGRLAAVREITGDALLTCTLDGEITSWSPAAAALYECDQREAVGSTFAALHAPEQAGEDTVLLSQVRLGRSR